MRDHLSDTTTYKSLTTSEIDRYSSDITKNILGWMKTHHKTLTKMERAFLRKKLKSNQSPYARFYLTLKAHKLKPGQTVDHLKSRPIFSCPGSLLHGLGFWVDRKLQEVAQRTVSYFKNTLELKKELLDLNLPRNAQLFTADAVSMYTNIPTHTALNLIGKYLNQYQRKHNNEYPHDAVRAGLRLIMTINIFTFGDLTLKQLNGTAMGTPPAPPYATVYYGIHEEKFLPHHAQRVMFYRRFIDDVIGIWCPHHNHKQDALEWDNFKNKMNAFPGLTWEFSERAKTINFMDMTISINNSNKIETNLFEKRLNLHLYIPPLSTHPPGLLPGIVYSTLFRIFTLCSDNEDKLQRTKVFLNASLPVSTKETKVGHYFTKQLCVQKHTVDQHKLRMTTTTASSSTYHFIETIPHLHVSKQHGDTHVAKPQWTLPLEHMKNPKTKEKCNIKRMIIAYKRPMNLGNLLSHRDIATSPPVSSYLYD